MKKFIKLGIIFLTLNLVYSQKAYAYLDPGTGSMIVQIIISAVAGIGCAAAMCKEKIINFFKRK